MDLDACVRMLLSDSADFIKEHFTSDNEEVSKTLLYLKQPEVFESTKRVWNVALDRAYKTKRGIKYVKFSVRLKNRIPRLKVSIIDEHGAIFVTLSFAESRGAYVKHTFYYEVQLC